MAEDFVEEEDVSCLMISSKKISSDQQLAMFMHRFNLDWDTIETMPALEKHHKTLFSQEIEE